ncbi:hypothetical protein HDG33_007567 [Paraburkholderia sp. Cpub6]|nr:hypothetical protein [Paraburkholderia sp. Cpub6]
MHTRTGGVAIDRIAITGNVRHAVGAFFYGARCPATPLSPIAARVMRAWRGPARAASISGRPNWN